jgi:tRNA dimethylallyltransferase
MDKIKYLPLLVILGPTASGKTNLAVKIADLNNGEIISADSRQIYKDMTIGTGKDLNEYILNGKQIPYHLIDIISPQTDFSVFHFQKEFHPIYNKILDRNSLPILCGGTGLYIESILLKYDMDEVEPNFDLREKLQKEDHTNLINYLKELNPYLHNSSDLSSKKRTIRAIEIGLSLNNKKDIKDQNNYKRDFNYCVIGIAPNREIVRKRITQRLKFRLQNGMIEEVESLLKNGLDRDRLNYFGLEYKFIGQFLDKKLYYNDMFQKLNTAIHQFSKRQMTFFRRMEKRGIKINWIENVELNSVKDILTNYFQE